MPSVQRSTIRITGTAEEIERLLPLLRAEGDQQIETASETQPSQHSEAKPASGYDANWYQRHQNGSAEFLAGVRTAANIRAALTRGGGLTPPQRAAFQILAQRFVQDPKGEVSLQELANSTKQTRRQTTGTLGGLGRRANRTLAMDRFAPGAPGVGLFVDERYDEAQLEHFYRLRPETMPILKETGVA